VVRVFPQPAADESMRSDPEMEAIGMQVAMQYEREHGREPEDVSSENLGHDIRSTTPSGQVRCIEVKARATTGAIVLTLNEWLVAQGLRDEDWLYIFENPRTAPRLHTIENPAAKLQPGEITKSVRHVIKNWKNGL
jgi:hypothetical protein